MAVQVERRLQHFEELVGHHARVVAVAQLGQHDGEFVAALARQRVALAQTLLQAAGGLLQQLVALDVAERVVDELEAVQVDEHDGEFRLLALGLDDGQAQAVLEQDAVRQVGQDVVVRLVRDDFLGALAVRDVARHAVGAVELELAHFLVGHVHADRVQRDRHEGVVERAFLVGAGVAFQAQLDVARGALVDAALVEHVARAFLVLVVHEDRVMLADQLFALVAEQLVGAVVDEREAAFVVQRVDDVGRAVHQVAVHLFRVFQLAGDAPVRLFQAALLEGVRDRLEQFLAAVRLAQVIVGAAFQRADRGVDADFPAHHDDLGGYALLVDEVHDLVAADVGQAQIEQHEVEAQARQVRQRLRSGGRGDQLVTAALQ